MQGLTVAEPKFPGDDGAADPAVEAALTAYAAGEGSEHAALTALAGSRLLVPVVALPAETGVHGTGTQDEAAGGEAPGDGITWGEADQGQAAEGAPAEAAGDNIPAALRQDVLRQDALRQEKSTEMALPILVGQDGRRAVLAFTSLDALKRWRSDARPVPVPAASAWLAGTQDASAVVIDVAGPVTLAVDGARLTALAAGRPVPLPHQDPDVLAALQAALAREPLIVAAALTTPDQRVTATGGAGPDYRGGVAGWGDDGLGGVAEEGAGVSSPGADLALQVTLAPGCDPAAAGAAVRRAADAMLAATGDRLRRGVEVSVAQAGQPDGPGRD